MRPDIDVVDEDLAHGWHFNSYLRCSIGLKLGLMQVPPHQSQETLSLRN